MTTEADAAAGAEPPTKRARREKLKKSDKNRWPQHPNIRNPEQRAKAYVRTAGLLKPKEMASLPLQDPSTIKLGRLLGGTDQRARHAAVLQLRAYLKARCDVDKDGLSEMDLLKLWKGLWYTLYMADKAPVQEELSAQIASLIWCFEGTEEEDEYAATAYMNMTDSGCGEDCDEDCEEHDNDEMEEEDASKSDDSYEVTMEEISNTLGDEDEEEEDDQESEEDNEGNTSFEEESEDGDKVQDDESDTEDVSEIRHCRGAHLASLFLRTYFSTLRREWGNMDKYRIDKFYTLTRFLLRESFQYMAKRHWSLGIIRLFNDTIYEEVLSKTPNGIRYHLIDITMEELARVNATAPMTLTEATFLDCLEPYFGLLQTSETLVHERVTEKIMKKFLEEHSVLSETYLKSDSDEGKELILDQVHVGTVAKFIFGVASDGATLDCHRKKVYGLNKLYYRRLKKVGKDVALDAHADDEDELVHSKHDFQPQFDNTGEADVVELETTEKAEDDDKTDEKHDKKKKKKKKKEKKQVEEIQSLQEPKVSLEEPKKKESSDKRVVEQNASKSPATRVGEPMKESEAGEHKSAVEGEKKKRKRPKKTNSQDNHDGDILGQSEEITISIQDQLKAKRAFEKEISDQLKKKKRKAFSEDSSSDNKRVKFGKTNLFRSWKASMKGLRDMIVPPSRVSSPEKGILRNKKVTAPRNSNVQKRKKAIDYFKKRGIVEQR
ncbi:ribosomal RNA-processing protein 1 [Fistulifera solaris]|uniref:Ribosomal RNA-processing protein 1 n=1 Tax=Fistulifera solaris TaxID=1519565 RepID=A0A1Z5KKN2_FISSO|nr:ribosomal RNA-processing protein 1 [Fistulifera solaris]|eukprot:GAX26591.1 ribosomal RNA-processing protein 1 [Fistulifera solaris]